MRAQAAGRGQVGGERAAWRSTRTTGSTRYVPGGTFRLPPLEGSPYALHVRERKVITVLFADLVGFTARAEQLDPEDVDAMLGPYHERLRSELESWGGTVEKFIGDAVVAFFGAPVAGEDDPERAVRAALAIRDWIVEEGKLQVRIAVNTGEALVRLGARPESGEGMATGDVVNTASRLQSAAPTNGILVGETTYRATNERIDYRGHPAVEAKGKEEQVPVWEVVEARARFGVDLTPESQTPLVGREREVELLVGSLERARQQHSTELVTLIGVPGIGKSRLVGELFQSVYRGGVLTYWRQGRSLPYGEGVSYWALAEMVKAQAGILETDGDAEAEAKLGRAVEQLIDDDAEWVLSHLRPLVGQGASAGSQEEAFAAWRRFFEALAEERSLVLVFEDIQWADDGLLDFIEYLGDWMRDVPVLILCTARLELLERRPAWGGGKINAATVALSPLTDEDTAKLIWALGAETPQDLLERCGGNPLYAEQYVRMLAERGSSDALPETVQGIIAARIDSLATEEKALLQTAAVVGKVFWLGALGASEQQFHPLQQKEFVARARRSSVDGETEYAFKHLLVRDVAYGQVPRADRAEKHLRVAEWIESLGRPEDHAEMVAHHYASALALMRAAGQDVDGVSSRARVAFRDAGTRALTLNAVAAASRYFSDALALTPADDPDRTELLYELGRARFFHLEEGGPELEAARDLFVAAGDAERAAEAELFLAQIAWRRGQSDGMRRHLEQAQALAGTERSRIRAAVLTEVSRYAMLAGQTDESLRAGREAIELAEELGLDELRAQALNNVGSALGNSGERDGLEKLEEGIALATQINAIGEVVRGLNNKAAQQVIYAQLDEGRETVRQLRTLAERYGYLGFLRFVDGGPEIGNRYQEGKWDDALARADAFLAGVEAGSPHYQAAGAYTFRALVRLACDDETGALTDAARGCELGARAGDPQINVSSLAFAGLVYAGVRDAPRVAEIADGLLRTVGSLPDIGWSVVVSPELAWIARSAGRGDDFRALLEGQPKYTPWLDAAEAIVNDDLRRAADILGEAGARPMEAFCRLRAAEALVAEGLRAEADEQLRPALAFYRGVGAARYVREGEALLAASA
jgi:class 3 adenylate cyclase/predicted ATPase